MSAPFWVWWAAPVAVTVVAWLVVLLAQRPREGATRKGESVDDYARFRQALARDDREGPGDAGQGPGGRP